MPEEVPASWHRAVLYQFLHVGWGTSMRIVLIILNPQSGYPATVPKPLKKEQPTPVTIAIVKEFIGITIGDREIHLLA